jgi:hypothetical protein
MKKTARFLSVLISLSMLAGALTACDNATVTDDEPSITTTTTEATTEAETTESPPPPDDSSQERQTFTLETPPSYVTFNSMTGNEYYPFADGDERNFVSVSVAGGEATDELIVSDEQEVFVFAYVHNNAAETLELVAENVMAKFDIGQTTPPTNDDWIPSQGSDLGRHYTSTITGEISWEHESSPYNSVSATARLVAQQPFRINYVEGSARFINGPSGADGWEIGNPTIGNGAMLGHEELDGRIQGCLEYSGWVRFAVNIEFEEPDFEFTNTARILGSGTGDDSWASEITARKDDIVEFRLQYTNYSGRVHDDVTVAFELDQRGFEYIVGSTTLYNGHNQDGLVVEDAIESNITVNGLYIGSGYTDGSPAVIIFQARVTRSGPFALHSSANIYTADGEINSTATVNVVA